jgi:hypothetical protein
MERGGPSARRNTCRVAGRTPAEHERRDDVATFGTLELRPSADA